MKNQENSFSRTERKEILFELKEELCHLLVDESPDPIFVLKNDNFEYLNRAFAKMVGVQDSRQNETDLEYVTSLVHPEDKARFLEWEGRIGNGSLKGQVLKHIRLITDNGRIFEADFSRAGDVGDKIIGVLRDRTELENFQMLFKNEKNIFSVLVEEASAPIFITQNGIITYANKAVLEVFGYDPDEVIGQPFVNYLAEKDRREIMALYAARDKAGPINSKLKFAVVHKSGHPVEVEMRVKRLEYGGTIKELAIMVDLSEQIRAEKQLQEALKAIRQAFGATVRVLNKLVEVKDPYTSGHQKRVSRLARLIAQEMKLETGLIERLRLASELHDIGKILIPAEILNKAGKLTESEWAIIKTHAELGYELIKDVNFPWPVADIILQHHERLDGSGYPRGLKGEEIILDARILAVADVYDAMSSFRPYRQAHPEVEAMNELEKSNLYDQEVVGALKKLLKENRLNKLF
ncbi:MAG: HD domain-containing phosphohydrolase [Candidatus Saccharicenans sp.]